MAEEIKYPVQRKICLRSKLWFGCKFPKQRIIWLKVQCLQ